LYKTFYKQGKYMGKKLIFVSGGARSGKSSFVQNWAIKNGNKVLFIATAERSDEEMSERIDVHINSRPQSWETIEIPLNISKSSSFSPNPRAIIGNLYFFAIAIKIPPFAVPSSLVIINPVIGIILLNSST